MSPESIVDSFPVLTLEQVYSVIACSLANQPEIDAYLQQSEADLPILASACVSKWLTLIFYF
jgi:hypothetical protein